MARIRLQPGQWGDVQLKALPDGRWRARVNYRDSGGEIRRVQRIAGSKTAAKRDALQAVEAVATAGIGITASLSVRELVEDYLAWGRAHKWRPQTADFYDYHAARQIYPMMGALRAHEATTPILEGHLQAIASRSAMRATRVVLMGAYARGIKLGVVSANPVTGTTPAPVATGKPVAISPADMATLRGAIQAWQKATSLPGGRAPYLLSFLDVLIGSGARPNEILALRWSDVDIPGRCISIHATVTRHKDNDGKSRLFLQETPKTVKGNRVVKLPDWAMAAIELQETSHWAHDAGAMTTPPGLVFPNSRGGLMDLANVRRTLREATKDTGLDFHPYLLRSTALTAVADVYGMVAARDIAGHTSTAITEAHYLQRAAVAMDASGALGDYRPAG